MTKHTFQQKPGVYKMINTLSGNMYIGSSKNVSKRLGIHKYNLRNNRFDNIRIKEDVLKYGIESFNFEVIEYCDDKNRFEREQYYFESLKPFYNVWPSIYSAKNRTYSIEQLANLKNIHRPIKDLESFSSKLKEAWKIRRNRVDGMKTLEMLDRTGKLHSEETKILYSKQRKGIPKSEETKEKIRRSRLGTTWDPISNKWVKKNRGAI